MSTTSDTVFQLLRRMLEGDRAAEAAFNDLMMEHEFLKDIKVHFNGRDLMFTKGITHFYTGTRVIRGYWGDPTSRANTKCGKWIKQRHTTNRSEVTCKKCIQSLEAQEREEKKNEQAALVSTD